MKNLIFGSVALLALAAAGPAAGADMPARPVYKAAPAMVSAYNWTGCYAGGGFGYGMWKQDFYQETDPGHVQYTASTTAGGNGWFGTVQGGCDYQFDRWVIGAFGDYDFGSIKGNVVIPAAAAVGEEKQRSAWSVGGRVGYLPMEGLLAFVSGGYTQARFNRIDLSNIHAPFNAFPVYYPAHNYVGWFLGTGYEYNLGWVPGLFWKTEYRYSTYRADHLSQLFTDGTPTGDAIYSKKNEQTIRSELVWRFNWGGVGKAPLVARY